MSKNLFLNAVRRKNKTGQLVFGTGTSIVCQELMDHLGVHFPQAHLDAEKMAALAIAGHTVLDLASKPPKIIRKGPYSAKKLYSLFPELVEGKEEDMPEDLTKGRSVIDISPDVRVGAAERSR